MFIKNTYDSQLKADRKPNQPLSPLAKEIKEAHRKKMKGWKIGSCKFGRFTYEQDEHVFSTDDIPKNKLHIVKSIKEFIDPDILGLKKREWNGSTLTAPGLEDNHARQLMSIRMGLMDQPIQKIQEPNIESGCDVRNQYTGWNVSVELPSIYQKKISVEEDTQQSQMHTKQFWDKKITLKTKELKKKEEEKKQNAKSSLSDVDDAKNESDKEDHIINYKNPIENVSELNEKLRKTKEEEKKIRDEIRKKFLFENPAASKEKVDAGVFRMTYEYKVRSMKPKSEEEAMNLTFKPDIHKTLRQEKYAKYYHNGSWGLNPLSPDVPVWTCCMNEDKESKGCTKIEIDPKRWNYSSYCCQKLKVNQEKKGVYTYSCMLLHDYLH